MSDAKQVQINFQTESVWGTTPSTAPQELRFTSESLAFNIENISSAEIRSDRQTTDLIQTGADASGGISFELSYGTFDDLIAGALWSTWEADVAVSIVTCIASKTDSTITSSATPFAAIATGQWIYMAGWTKDSGNNNGFYLCTGALPATLTVSPSIGTQETDLSAVKTLTIVGAHLKNGVTEKNFSIERQHTDLDPDVFFHFTGMTVNQMSMSIQANSVLTGSFDFIGKSATISSASSSFSPATPDAATTTDVMNAVANVGNILENDTAVSTCLVQGLDFTVNNNIRGLDSIGSLGNCDIGVGQLDVTGSLNAYFKDKSLYAKYLAGTETSISFRVSDGDTTNAVDGNVYIITFHRVKFETDAVNATGSNTDVMENISWRAIRHAARDATITIDKFVIA